MRAIGPFFDDLGSLIIGIGSGAFLYKSADH